MSLDNLFAAEPYSLASREKQSLLLPELLHLTDHHRQHCPEYNSILKAISQNNIGHCDALETLPMLPVRLFKLLTLISVPQNQIIKTLTSSGTTSQTVSSIYLDDETSVRQIRALTSIVSSFIGKKRLPMVLIDAKTTLNNRKSISARGTGLMGMSFFGADHFFLLDQDMNVRWEEFEAYLEKHKGQPLLLFGFTYMVWKYLYLPLLEKQKKLNLDTSILIHSGGWKKMQELAVNNEQFKAELQKQMGLRRIHNFYGMVEQVGSIFMECEHGYLHAPNFSDIIIRNFTTFEPNSPGKAGIVQLVSALPYSYPGHSLLTEDIGVVWGEDACPCGRKGRFFSINGRLSAAELRGCSDTYAFNGEASS